MENDKLKMWDAKGSFDQAESAWEEGAKSLACKHPLKGLKSLPMMPGITKETAKHLKWKALKWMIAKDDKKEIRKGFLKSPLKYGFGYLKSLFSRASYIKDDDFFLYGIQSVKEFKELLINPKTLLVVGFSYCHKPFECPSGRFSENCIHDASHPVCRQCFIGKTIHALPRTNTIVLSIPTVHYIGGKIFEIVNSHPEKQVVFLITACELTLKMFGDFGNMVNVKGIGVRLDGRICNTMKAFALSEKGIKPGLTVVLDKTKKRIFDLIKFLRES